MAAALQVVASRQATVAAAAATYRVAAADDRSTSPPDATLSLPMTAEEAGRQAEAEGLTLLEADSISGYKGVSFNNNCKAKPYQAKVYRGGKSVSIGMFATAEEAALAFARASAPHTASLRKRKAELEQEDAEDDAEDDYY